MRKSMFTGWLFHAMLLCGAHGAWAFHTIPCSNVTIQDAINAIAAEEKANGGAAGVDYYIALGGGLVFNEPVVIKDNGTPGGVVIAILGGLAIDPTDPNQCAASPGVFDGSQTVMSGGGRFSQSVIQVTGHASVGLYGLVLSGANLSGSGGGISFDGTGSLDLFGVTIADNIAGSGAGIHANGSAPGLDVNFHDLVLPNGGYLINFVENNRATNGSGGGMDLSGETFFTAVGDGLIVYQNTASGNGGGMAFSGRGSIQLAHSVISENTAGNGGGLYADPSAGPQPDITFYDGVDIDSNKAANDGGGVYLANQAALQEIATTDPTLVFSNKALGSSGRGGGLFIAAPASVKSFSGLIGYNTAADGGGIALTCPSENDYVDVTLNGRAGANPVTIESNTAARSGGGIYSDASGNGGNCSVHASNFTLHANTALEGSALFGKGSNGGAATFLLNGGDACSGKPDCNAIAGNLLGNGATNGSTMRLAQRTHLQTVSTKIQGNQATHVLSADDVLGYANLKIGLISGNTTGGSLIDTDAGMLSVQDTTIADNAILDGSTVIRASNVFFYNNIVSEQEPDTFDFAGNADGGHNIADVLTSALDNTMSRADGLVLHGRPTFVDAANGDYHLAPYSLGIDAGAANPQLPVDLDRAQRDIDEALIPNADGPRDLGAYEFRGVLTSRACMASDEIFCSQFE